MPQQAPDPKRDAKRAADPASTSVVDTKSVITPPIADPVQLGSATPIPPAVVGGPLPEPEEQVAGEVIPDPKDIDGADQNRLEVLTGKRLQKTSTPVDPEKYVKDQQAHTNH